MSDKSNDTPASAPDQLVSITAADELSDQQLDGVAGGGTVDVTVNKAKTADKAFQAMDAYIRG